MSTPYLPPVQTDCVVDLYHGDTIADPVAAFNAAKASGVEMIIHKASQGSGVTDDTFTARRDAAGQAGLLFAAYHFCDASTSTAQVANFLSAVGDASKTPLALDAELNPKSQVSITQLITMADAVAQGIGRKLDWLYMGASGPDGNGTGMTDAAMAQLASLVTDLWLPEYGSRPICPLGFNTWIMHQYTGDGINGSGYVAGIGSKLDRSYFAGTVADLHTYVAHLLGSSPSVVPAVTMPPTAAPTPPQVLTITLDTKAHIAAAQAALVQAGLYTGRIDGISGPKTAAALAAWR